MAAKATQYRAVAAASLEQRGEQRHRVCLTRATVRRDGKGVIDAHLYDISIYGCRVACRELHAEGERVGVRLAGGLPIAATVIWCRDGFVACRFDAPIARAVVRALIIGVALV